MHSESHAVGGEFAWIIITEVLFHLSQFFLGINQVLHFDVKSVEVGIDSIFFVPQSIKVDPSVLATLWYSILQITALIIQIILCCVIVGKFLRENICFLFGDGPIISYRLLSSPDSCDLGCFRIFCSLFSCFFICLDTSCLGLIVLFDSQGIILIELIT